MHMDSMSEMRKNNSAIPVVEERIQRLERLIKETQKKHNELLDKWNSEKRDIELLEKKSFSSMLLRLFDKYEDRRDKEMSEELNARLEFDEVAEKLNSLKKSLEEAYAQAQQLRENTKNYERELANRRSMMNSSNENYERYSEIQAQIAAISRQLIETEEAARAARRIMDTVNQARAVLSSADDRATYDIWFKTGIIGHMAKYDKIDTAERLFSRVNSQLKDLKKELGDIDIKVNAGLSEISSSQRAVDFWFDNIFTDLSVRDTIRNNSEGISKIAGKISRVLSEIESKRQQFISQIARLEKEEEELLVGIKD